jgi:hypothetical protein
MKSKKFATSKDFLAARKDFLTAHKQRFKSPTLAVYLGEESVIFLLLLFRFEFERSLWEGWEEKYGEEEEIGFEGSFQRVFIFF